MRKRTIAVLLVVLLFLSADVSLYLRGYRPFLYAIPGGVNVGLDHPRLECERGATVSLRRVGRYSRCRMVMYLLPKGYKIPVSKDGRPVWINPKGFKRIYR
jgi:hypothetical protein